MAKNAKGLYDRVSGDTTAPSLFAEYGENLEEVLATFIKKWNAETIVIGGNIINSWDLFIPEISAVLNSQPLKALPLRAALGEEAALMGAGSL